MMISATRYEVEIHEQTSWSCAHGVERWRADCGCHVGREPGWTQAWRAPLRAAIDWLRGALVAVYEAAADGVLRDPSGARDRYIDCVLEPDRWEAFLAAEAGPGVSATGTLRARRSLSSWHALAMQTSRVVLRRPGRRRAADHPPACGTRDRAPRRSGRGSRRDSWSASSRRSNLAEEESGADLYGMWSLAARRRRHACGLRG
jgi:hypothetical protein